MAIFLLQEQQKLGLRDLYSKFVDEPAWENYKNLIENVIENYRTPYGKSCARRLYGDTHPASQEDPVISQIDPTIEQLRDLIYDKTSYERFSRVVREFAA